MKPILRNKWFRRLCQTLLALVSLLILAVVAINWWGARMKRDLIAQMCAAGRPTSIAEMLEPLPPDNDNFAMIPILAQARDEYWHGPSNGKSPTPDQARSKLAALGAPSLKGNRGFGKAGKPDLSRWKEALQLSGSDAECLAAYDQQFGDILAQLREGLSRLHTASPLLHRVAAATEIEPACFGFPPCLIELASGIRFRAELGLAAARPEIAQESLLIYLRLAELIHSDAYLMGQAFQNTFIYQIKPTFARTLASGQWNQAQLAALHDALARLDALRGNRRDLDLDNVYLFAWFERRKTHPDERRNLLNTTRGLRRYPMPAWLNDSLIKIDETLAKALPDGWFDANAALAVDAGVQLRNELGESDNLGLWLRVCDHAKSHTAALSVWNGWRQGTGYGRDWPTSLLYEPHVQILLQQARLACDLEIHRLKHGRYPANLRDLQGAAIIDSLTGEPFIYRITDTSYRLYSVGADGKDDGGEPSGHNPGKDLDWVW